MILEDLLTSYSRNSLDALVDALLPETPELAEQRGPEHEPGASRTELADQLQAAFNHLQATGVLGDSPEDSEEELPEPARTTPVIALLLDFGSLEFLLRGRNEEPPGFRVGGPFQWLQPEDRLRVIDFLNGDSMVRRTVNLLEDRIPYVGLVDFMLDGLVTMPLLHYYSEWPGYEDDQNRLKPDPETFREPVQSWLQTKFPGRAEGYAVLMGYEVESFEENDWS